MSALRGGGGRYDKLVEICGGKSTPGIGFAVGFERIYLALQELGVNLAGDDIHCVYVACAEPHLRDKVFEIVYKLRSAGVRTECDYQERSLKSQFKQADKLNADITIIVGSDELSRDVVTVRNMESHEQVEVPVADITTYVTSH